MLARHLDTGGPEVHVNTMVATLKASGLVWKRTRHSFKKAEATTPSGKRSVETLSWRIWTRQEDQARRLGWVPRTCAALVLLGRIARRLRYQRFYALPEIIRHFPRVGMGLSHLCILRRVQCDSTRILNNLRINP